MTRGQCENMIAGVLEYIRHLVRQYDPNIRHVSMYISDMTSSAWALSDPLNADSEYLLKVDVKQEAEDNDDC